MLDFDSYISRHGEHGVQAILERIERAEGLRFCVSTSLEARWKAVMLNDNAAAPETRRMAA